MRHTKKQESKVHSQGIKQTLETVPGEAWKLDFLDLDFKSST